MKTENIQSISLYLHTSIVSVNLFMCLSIHLSVHLCVCLGVCLTPLSWYPVTIIVSYTSLYYPY